MSNQIAICHRMYTSEYHIPWLKETFLQNFKSVYSFLQMQVNEVSERVKKKRKKKNKSEVEGKKKNNGKYV